MRMEMRTGMGTLLPCMHTSWATGVCPCPGLGRWPSSPELPVGWQLVGGVIAEQP